MKNNHEKGGEKNRGIAMKLEIIFFYHVVITVFFPAHSKYADVLNKYAKIRTKTNNAQDVRNRKKEKNQWQLKKKWGNFFKPKKSWDFSAK